MGYYTYHELEIDEVIDYNVDYEAIINIASGYNGLFDEEPVKWYKREQDMIKISKLYPENIFKIIGEGEESGDLWHEYYKNGQVQLCKAIITYEEYDENKLK